MGSSQAKVIAEDGWHEAALPFAEGATDPWSGAVPLQPFPTPLTQVLLSLRLAGANGAPARELPPNTILREAVQHYARGARPEPFLDEGLGMLWAPVNRLHTSALNARFSNQVSRMTHRLGAGLAFVHERRSYLENLLFHPLQNAYLHAGRRQGGLDFAGLSMRRTRTMEPFTASMQEYHHDVFESSFDVESGFLEVLIHDDGEGIAAHYRNSKVPNARPLAHFHQNREWVWLKRAFERHASSRYFRESVDSEGYQPGIGLAATLSAVKHLGAYLEVRCGRIRGFQFFPSTMRISRESLLRPDTVPAEGPFFRGTIIRIFVPIQSKS
jgi:hypothetical protein